MQALGFLSSKISRTQSLSQCTILKALLAVILIGNLSKGFPVFADNAAGAASTPQDSSALKKGEHDKSSTLKSAPDTTNAALIDDKKLNPPNPPGPTTVLISAPALIAELNKALAVGLNGDLDKGILLLGDIIKKAPGMALAYNDRGMLFYRSNRLNPAEEDLNKALELDSSNSEYWSNRGLVRMMKGSEDNALKDLDRAISLSKTNLLAFATRGAIYLRRLQFEKARADFDQALETDPKSIINLNNRAMARFQMGDQKGAIADAEAALAIDPGSAVVHKNLQLFKTMVPGQISVKTQTQYSVKQSEIDQSKIVEPK
jgi:tetratricopeptide (TPR) repeat protein